MNLQLENKTALVTGSTKGIGFAIEVASMVAYLCPPIASATNGAAMRVDGGVLRGTV